MANNRTEIVLEGKVEGLGAYKTLKKELRDLSNDIKSLNLQGKQESDIYKQKELRLKVLSGAVKQADSEVKKLTASTKMSTAQFLNFGKNISTIGIGLGLLATQVGRIMGTITRAIGGLVNGLVEVEQSNRKLIASSKLFGVSLTSLTNLAKGAKDEFKLSTVFANDFVTEITKLTSMAGQTEKTGQVLKAALDLGAAQGLDAEGVLTAIHQTILGIDEGTDKLFQKNPSQIYKEYAEEIGTTVGKMTDLQKKQALVNEFLEKGALVQGEYNNLLKTTAGSIQVFNVSLQDIVQELGTALQPVISAVAGYVADFATNLKELPTGAKIAIAAIGLIIIAVGGLTAAFVALAVSTSVATAGISFLIGAGVVALGGALAGVTAIVVSHINEIKEWWNNNEGLRNAVANLRLEVGRLVNKLSGGSGLSGAMSLVLSFGKEWVNFWLPKSIALARILIDVLSWVVTAVKDVAKWLDNAAKSVQGFVDDLMNFVDAITGIKSILASKPATTFFDVIGESISYITTGLFGVLSLLNKIGKSSDAPIFDVNKDATDAVDKIQNKLKPLIDLGFFEKGGDTLPPKPPTSGKGKSGKEDEDPLDKLLASVKANIEAAELEYKLNLDILSVELKRLQAAHGLADTREKMNKLLSAERDIEKDQWELRAKNISGFKPQEMTTSDFFTNRNTPLLVGTGTDPFGGSSDFGVIIELMRGGMEDVRSSIDETLDGLQSIFGIFGDATSQFVGDMINAFNSVLNLISGIINIISQMSSGGGILGGLFGLFKIFAAPVTGGASLAIPSFAVGTDNFPGVGMVHQNELLVNKNIGSVINNKNTERLFNMMSSVGRTQNINNNTNKVDVMITDGGMIEIFSAGQMLYKKRIKQLMG